MRVRSLIIFILSASLALTAAGFRFYDSSHAMGMLSLKGGKARHPFHLDPGKSLYTLIATGVVLPPYKGDARVVLEGAPAMSYTIYDSAPIVELGLHRRPRFENGTLFDLQPKDRLALWVVMKPGSDNELPANSGKAEEQTNAASPPLTLAFYDTRTNRPLLKIPVAFNAVGGSHVD